MKDSFILSASDLARITNNHTSTTSVILSRSYYAPYEQRVKVLTCQGKLHSTRGYLITPEFLAQFKSDLDSVRSKKSVNKCK